MAQKSIHTAFRLLPAIYHLLKEDSVRSGTSMNKILHEVLIAHYLGKVSK